MVADGTSLPFLDRTFGTAKAFFFLMYVLDADREAVFAEAFRVLKPGGRFYVWDVTIPDKGDRPQRGFAVFVKAELSDRTIETGYGVSWEGKEMSAGTIGELAKRAGFYLIEAGKPSEKTFRLAFRRPDS